MSADHNLSSMAPTLSLGVVGAGPVGLALALHAAEQLPQARVTLYDARPAERDVSGDPRTLALSLGSVQLLERLKAWPDAVAQPIQEVVVSQAPPSLTGVFSDWFGDPIVRILASEEKVPMLGAVLRYGQVVAPLQQRWNERVAAEPHRLFSRFGTAVGDLKQLDGKGVEIDAGIAEQVDVAILAEGGVFSDTPPASVRARSGWRHDYQQVAWVGTVTLDGASDGVAHERFTRHGPLALLPLKRGAGPHEAALVWCVSANDDPVEPLTDTQRIAVLNAELDRSAGRVQGLSTLKRFPLGLTAERSLTHGRVVRIGNAAQTLHPVAGQGLNLGLRDAAELVHGLRRHTHDVDRALRSLEWQRGPDRWATIAATDFLARSFTWQLPGAGPARGLGLAALQVARPLKSLLARRMMFGSR